MRFWRQLLGVMCLVPCMGIAALPVSAQATRWGHTSTLLPNGNVLIVGGATDAAGTPANSTEIWISTDGLAAVQVGAAMTTRRSSHTATLLPDGKVLVTGGIDNTATVQNTAEIYNPLTNTWSTPVGMGLMSSRRMNHTATLLPNGNMLVAGGQTTQAGAVTNTCDILNYSNPAAPVWAACTSLGKERAIHTATLLHDGRVMVAGGILANGADFAVSTEFFDYQAAAAGNWTPGPSLIVKRAYHTATQLGNTKVLIAGGFNGRNIRQSLGFLDSVEIYDAVSNTITPGPRMAGRKFMHTSVLGPDGVAYVAGGFGNVTTSYANIDVPFEPGSVVCLDQTTASSTTARFILNHAGWGGSPACNSTLALDLLNIPLTDNVSGRLIDGEIRYSSGTVLVETGELLFDNPGTTSELDSVNVESGLFSGVIPFDQPINGRFNSRDIDTAANSDVGFVNASNLVLDPAADLDAGETADIVGGQVRFLMTLGIPDIYASAGMYALHARIITMTFSREAGAGGPGGTGLGFDAELSSGTAVFPNPGNPGDTCGAAFYDVIGGWAISCTLTFTGIDGSVTNTTDTAIGYPAFFDLTNPQLNPDGIEIRIRYTMDRLNVGGLLFTTDVSTIVVTTMGYSDELEFLTDDNSWDFGDLLEEPVFNHSTLLLPNGDRAVFKGRMCQAFPDAGNTCSSLVYDPRAPVQVQVPRLTESAVFESRAVMGNARSKHASVQLADQTVLIAGGVQGPNPMRLSEIYDPREDEYRATSNLQTARSLHSLTLLPNGTVLAAGGFTSANSTGSTNTAEIYYPETDVWIETTPMASSRTFHTAVLLPDGNVLVAGGVTNGMFLDTAEIYFSTSHTWGTLTPMDTERAQHTATLLKNGTVLVTGGVNVGGVLGASTLAGQTPGTRGGEIYNPADNSWTSAGVPPVMNTPRHSHTATLLQDGSVLAAGGNDGYGEIGEAEVYRPGNTWTVTDPSGTGPGRDMIIPRLSHTATLAPNNKVWFIGGFLADGTPVEVNESFDVNFTSFTVQGKLGRRRGHHTVVLAESALNVFGGSDGMADLDATEGEIFSLMEGDNGIRRPTIIRLDTGTVRQNGYLSVFGNRFHGRGDASSGSTSRSHHSHPRVYLDRLDGNPSGFSVDLTTYVINATLFGTSDIGQKWINANSSITVQLPDNDQEMPWGNYLLRVANNAFFSEGVLLKVGPPAPSGAPSVPIGTLLGVSSISWTWNGGAVSGHDGYNIYDSTTGVWIATVPAGAGQFVQTNLGADNTVLIEIAPYSITGNGIVVAATIPVTTLNGNVGSVSGIAQSAGSIEWRWAENAAAVTYNIYNATTGLVIANVATESYLQAGLSTNTVNAIRIQAVTDAGVGALTNATSVYTLAALPLPYGALPLTNVSTGGFHARWWYNTNPLDTSFSLRYYDDVTDSSTTVIPIDDDEYTITGQDPNALFTVYVAAENGDGILTDYVLLGSTPTYAATPGTATVNNATPSSINVSWSANGNPSTTTYQVLLSTDAFATHFSTPIPFSDQYRETEATLNNLFTGLTYDIRIYARNRYGIETLPVSTRAFTDNGGGPIGSLSLLLSNGSGGSITGNLSNGRNISIIVQPGTFVGTTRLFISADTKINCSNSNIAYTTAAISITAVPAAQPLKPIRVGIQYATPGDVSVTQLGTLGMVRYDPTGSQCVPLLSSLEKGNNSGFVYALLNHLSTFQLATITPATDLTQARIFPNPFYTRNDGFVTFDTIPANTRVRIYTIHGARVFEGSANSSGILTWDGRNSVGRPIASGLYVVLLEGGDLERIMKLAVVR